MAVRGILPKAADEVGGAAKTESLQVPCGNGGRVALVAHHHDHVVEARGSVHRRAAGRVEAPFEDEPIDHSAWSKVKMST